MDSSVSGVGAEETREERGLPRYSALLLLSLYFLVMLDEQRTQSFTP